VLTKKDCLRHVLQCAAVRAEEKSNERVMWENFGKVRVLRGKQKDARKM
jgi:hypothetical protein